MALLQGMSVGEGDVYTTYEPECYNKIMSILNDPENEWYQMIADDSGFSIDEIKTIMGKFVYSSDYNVYYWPDHEDTSWDLLGGEYGDLALIFETIGDEEGVFCGLGATTIINSHQGTAGF